MNNYIDVKVSVWYRLHFNEYANMKGLADLIQESGLDEVIDEKLGFVDSDILHETQERLTPQIMTASRLLKCMRMAKRYGTIKRHR